jgi:hypothetical protein
MRGSGPRRSRPSTSPTYDRSVQRFASVRAAREAEIRLAKVLADQIKTRMLGREAGIGSVDQDHGDAGIGAPPQQALDLAGLDW